jgi:hypothetical protein
MSYKLSLAVDFIHQQNLLINWAKAYEEGEPMVSDKLYDMSVKMLIGHIGNNPEEWKEQIMPEFEDGSWQYTGSFYR